MGPGFSCSVQRSAQSRGLVVAVLSCATAPGHRDAPVSVGYPEGGPGEVRWLTEEGVRRSSYDEGPFVVANSPAHVCSADQAKEVPHRTRTKVF